MDPRQQAPGAAIDPAILDSIGQYTGGNAPPVGGTAGTMPRASWTAGQASVDPAVAAEIARSGAQPGGHNATGGGGGGGGGDSMFAMQAAQLAMQLAEAAAQREYLNARMREVEIPSMRLLDEREKERLRQEAARDAWNRTYQQATLDIQNGTLDLSKYQTTAAATGYVPGEAGPAAKVHAAWDRLPPEQKTTERAAHIWSQVVPGLNPAEAMQLAQAGKEYYQQTGQRLPDAAAEARIRAVTGGRVTGATPTLARDQLTADRERDAARLAFDRERTGNDTTLALLEMQANLRGPGDWAKYMQTAQAIPPEMRALIGQTAGRFAMPTAPGNAASVAGMVGDIGRPDGVSGQNGGTGTGVAVTPRVPGTAPTPWPATPGAPTPNPNAGARVGQIYRDVVARRGVSSLGADDPELVAAVGSGLSLTPQQTHQLLQAGKDYAVANGGQAPPDAVMQGALDRITGGGVQTTQPAGGMPMPAAPPGMAGPALGQPTRSAGGVPGFYGPGGPGEGPMVTDMQYRPENQTMNAAIRAAAGVPGAGMTDRQPQSILRTSVPGATPAPVAAAPAARYLTGNQLPRSFMGAGADAQEFVLGGAEAAGESKRQILHEFSQSMPKYQGSRAGRVRR